jgi:hypothetical protein
MDSYLLKDRHGIQNGVIDEKHDRLYSVNYPQVLVFDPNRINDDSKALHWIGTPGEKKHISAAGFDFVNELAFDEVHDRLFVLDHHRILVFETSKLKDGMAATGVIGQPDFLSAEETTALTGFSFPQAMAYDPKRDRLYVSFVGGGKVLVYDVSKLEIGMKPILVLGRRELPKESEAAMMAPPGLWIVFEPILSRIGAWRYRIEDKIHGYGKWRLYSPEGLAFDAVHDRLFVADTDGNRVMVFDTSNMQNGMNASYVLGQPGFTTYERRPNSATTLYSPKTVRYDARRNRLFVQNGQRISVFNVSKLKNNMPADAVIGQESMTADFFPELGQKLGPEKFDIVFDLTYDPVRDRLYASSLERTLVFDTSKIATGMSAIAVIGKAKK